MDIHVLWALIICFSAVMYTIFDGFDLGVGILIPFVLKENQRDTIVDSITPVWDGNETWLILMGVGLFGGFPRAYSVLLPALYIPLILMLLSLILRGVAMEFRFMSATRKTSWDITFALGSILAAFCQGIILGNLMEGIKTDKNFNYANTAFSFISPFTILIGFTLIVTYALIGATWLNLKTSGSLQRGFKIYVRRIVVILVLLFVVIIWGRFYWGIFTPRYGVFGIRSILSAASVIWYVLTLAIMAGIYLTINSSRDRIPFFLNMLMTVVSALYLVSGFWPYIIPPGLTIFDAGSPAYGNRILLISSFVIIPIILCYLIYSYSVFKGKVNGNNYEPVLRAEDVALKPVKLSDHKDLFIKQLTLSWPWRIIISIAGVLFFFLVLGFEGDTVAQLSILIFIVAFLIACFRYKN
ncbi:cytochrome d ubiquinol oxidase subunit II [Mucilaginibacter sp.]|uniref:cytochrome d ubiquinol oxidase subunit II n=1 Tax=Mucilaginibacter sp. TaxID=1882438 RepID=UPI0026331985|nr:cytochrome d ubiquinol oxidase subunit II [Mucilaginibacter sp.]MDB4922962.1 cydB [Mucilaginibacter sp.]